MGIRVALHHVTAYRYDRPVGLSPHEVRLRPAPHCRTPILSYSLTVEPSEHFINWQQDAYGNHVARFVFTGKSRLLTVTVDLVADMTVINPFDFFIDASAERFPFVYADALAEELGPYLLRLPAAPVFADWLERARAALLANGPMQTTNFLVALNQRLQADIAYLVRMEPGVQTPEETLALGRGSCRDSSWLLVQLLRHLGLAARFVSGYLIQLKPDQVALDGPAGPATDFTDLHAWAEVYVPGAGWIGLDPTSGLLTGEGHIPLASTASPGSAAPVIGSTEIADVHFDHVMRVTRLREDPRVTRPYVDEDWEAIDALGTAVDAELASLDVRLTQGGEPTFVSVDDVESPQWNTAALGADKRSRAEVLAARLRAQFAPQGLIHEGQGKWYPGEPLPRWALNLFWRTDGKPLWQDPRWLLPGRVDVDVTMAGAIDRAADDEARSRAHRFARTLTGLLGIDPGYLIDAHEDPWRQLVDAERLPVNASLKTLDLAKAHDRQRVMRLLEEAPARLVGHVLPLKPAAGAPGRWRSSRWPLRRERLYLIDGDSALGLRLPLDSLPWVLPDDMEPDFGADPFEPKPALDGLDETRARIEAMASIDAAPPDRAAVDTTGSRSSGEGGEGGEGHSGTEGDDDDLAFDPREVVHTALCIEARHGRVHVFLPPVPRLEPFLALLAAIELCATRLACPIVVEGYPPPRDTRLRLLSVTPDPGVIEVNVHPSSNWRDLVDTTTSLYEHARQSRLATEKFMLDGRHTGTGGGNHVTLGGATPADSPMLRRPDLLRSLVSYWQNHPSLSYLFSGTFVGPTSQSPRVDEARDDNLYELSIAFQQMERALPGAKQSERPWLVDRLLRHLLVDLTGNTHRAEFSIDKLYSPDGPTGRLGLVEFRAFEMPPHPRMSLVQMLLLRTLVARFWREPYRGALVHWGTDLHDRWLLPHYVTEDIRDVARDLRAAGYPFEDRWFDPFIEFRFPRYGTAHYEGIELELRQAIEPWHVLGEEMARGGTARYVDSSVERLQLRARGLTEGRHQVACNGRLAPLRPTGVPGEFVCGVRFRAWDPPSALHPTIGVHAPLIFDIVDTWSQRSIGGCVYHVAHPGGRNYETFPVNANEAEARRLARFWGHGHTPGPMRAATEAPNPRFPTTLDLRWMPT